MENPLLLDKFFYSSGLAAGNKSDGGGDSFDGRRKLRVNCLYRNTEQAGDVLIFHLFLLGELEDEFAPGRKLFNGFVDAQTEGVADGEFGGVCLLRGKIRRPFSKRKQMFLLLLLFGAFVSDTNEHICFEIFDLVQLKAS